jgi:hypothetical protein
MHLNDGQLRASLDHEASEQEAAHLQACGECQRRLAELVERSEHASRSMSIFGSHSSTNIPSASIGRARFNSYITRKESQSMFRKLFSRSNRPVWAGVGLVAILAISMAFAPVRAIANSFLGLFRVEQVMVVQVNPANIPEDFGSSQNLEAIFAEDVQVTGQGEPQTVANVEEASKIAGIPVRLPTEASGDLKLEVKSPMQMTFNVNTAHIQAILDELGRTDIKIPAGIDGSKVTVDLPAVVAATYGDCNTPIVSRRPIEARPEGFDPDDPSTFLVSRCVNLIQMASPTITAPPGVDLQQIGQAYLEMIGMETEDAARFSQNIDWSTTLVLPMPTDSSEYSEVSVDGVTGTLIQSTSRYGMNSYVVLWVADGVVYALSGNGAASTALAIANSIK